MQLTAPKDIPSRTVYTKKYGSFRGVDFSTDATQVSDSRSPWAPNLIADEGLYPEKRPGWQTLHTLTGAVNGLYTLNTGSETVMLAHVGTKLYTFTQEETAQVYAAMADARSTGFIYKNKLYLLDGAHYVVFDGTSASEVEGFVPTTTIGINKDGGGTALEAVNLLSSARMNSIAGDGTTKTFQLDTKDIAAVNKVTIAGEETTAYTADLAAGKITFTDAPPEDAAGGGIPNVVVTFTKTVDGAADKIKKCRIASWFGKGNDSRVFVAGNPDYPNMDWASGLYDPTYFPDTGYTEIGADNAPIMGYLRQFENQLIVKADNGQDATIYSRTAAMENTGAVFPVEQGVAGVGAISRYAFASLRDDPLFLSREGVFGVTLAYGGAKAQRSTQNRSHFVDARLTRETLADAAAVVWNGFYILSVPGGRCYAADGRQRSGNEAQETYGYEWYYWENVPARVWLEHEGELWFGTEDGRICRFQTDETRMSRYADDGEAIVAEWVTKADDDGDFMTKKTMKKKGGGLLLKPYTRSSVKVIMKTDTGEEKTVRTASAAIFDFSDIDFENFSFNTSTSPQVIPFGKKVKKYKTLQIIVRNDKVNEGFGVFGIIKRFVKGGYVKR